MISSTSRQLGVVLAAYETEDLVALVGQQLAEVEAVLAGDAGDEGAGHSVSRARDRVTANLTVRRNGRVLRVRQAPVGVGAPVGGWLLMNV